MTPRVTAPAVRARKGADEPLVMVTAYDAPGARIADAAGVDIILVGDSLAMVVLGYDDTLSVTVDDMAHHTAAVARARPRPMVVTDLPWLSYHLGADDAVRNAARLIRAGAQAVKLEGGRRRLPAIEAIIDAEIPVMGHIGLTPQSVHMMGGFRVQGKDLDAAEALVADAQALADAGCFAIVLEGVPDSVAARVTAAVPVPTIGIGAGPACDGQVLVFHDLLGLEDRVLPRFVRRYASLKADAVAAMAAYAGDVRARRFPTHAESYHLPPDPARQLGDVRGARPAAVAVPAGAAAAGAGAVAAGAGAGAVAAGAGAGAAAAGAGAGAGLAGSGLAGSGLAGSGLAGSGLAGSGLAGSGLAGSGLAGSGLAGPGPAPAEQVIGLYGRV